MKKYAYSGRTDQAKASFQRWKDAQRLKDQQRWRGAMYLAGYTIECKLKCQLMEMFGVNHIKDLEAEIEKRSQQKINLFTHRIEFLFELSGVRNRMVSSPVNNKIILSYLQCNKWTTSWRYAPDQGNRDECETFMQAVKDFGSYIDNNI